MSKNEPNNNWSAYTQSYSEDSLWDKLAKVAKNVGCEGIRNALRLYYVLEDPNLPTKTKMIIYGALGYFISPIDIIPDIMPVVGFTDDIAVLAAAITMASMYITTDVKARADTKLSDWFGEGSC